MQSWHTRQTSKIKKFLILTWLIHYVSLEARGPSLTFLPNPGGPNTVLKLSGFSEQHLSQAVTFTYSPAQEYQHKCSSEVHLVTTKLSPESPVKNYRNWSTRSGLYAVPKQESCTKSPTEKSFNKYNSPAQKSHTEHKQCSSAKNHEWLSYRQ